jgi:hypothetical protein
MRRFWPATATYDNRDAGHVCYALTCTEAPQKPLRRTIMSLLVPWEPAAGEEIALPNTGALGVNRNNTKAYQTGYAHGMTAAREEGVEFPLSAQAAGRADEALRTTVGVETMSRMLGVKKPLDSGIPRKTTLQFQVACDEYNAGYAAGWDAEELGALARVANL